MMGIIVVIYELMLCLAFISGLVLTVYIISKEKFQDSTEKFLWVAVGITFNIFALLVYSIYRKREF